MDLILSDDKYERYEQAILRRDRCRKEAEHTRIQYVKTFGDLLEKSYTLMIDCIRLKKMIAFCQARVNSGTEINGGELDEFVAREMKSYEEELKRLQDARDVETKPLAEYDVQKIRKIYREIVKAIHPDLNPELYEKPEIADLWAQTVAAYNANDLKGLEELSVLVATAKARFDDGSVKVYITDIEDRIAKIEEEIEKITSTDPYLFKLLLSDPAACEEKRASLRDEIAEFESYKVDLQKALAGFDIQR